MRQRTIGEKLNQPKLTLQKTWSDSARQAALDARRANKGDGHKAAVANEGDHAKSQADGHGDIKAEAFPGAGVHVSIGKDKEIASLHNAMYGGQFEATATVTAGGSKVILKQDDTANDESYQSIFTKEGNAWVNHDEKIAFPNSKEFVAYAHHRLDAMSQDDGIDNASYHLGGGSNPEKFYASLKGKAPAPQVTRRVVRGSRY